MAAVAQEDPDEHTLKRTQYFAGLSRRINPSQQLFEVAAEMRNATSLVQKSLSDCLFSVADCDIVEKKLREQHNIVMTSKQIRSNLNVACYAFEEYCSLMKMGREGLFFDRDTGRVLIPGAHGFFDPIMAKQTNIERSHMDAILNFNILKAIFPFLWDKYFKDGSKKRSGSGMLGSSSKRSKETSSLKLVSSVNPNPNLYMQVLDRLRELFGNGPNKHLTKAYGDAAALHYGKDEIACSIFLAYEDDDAKAAFASKTNIDILHM